MKERKSEFPTLHLLERHCREVSHLKMYYMWVIFFAELCKGLKLFGAERWDLFFLPYSHFSPQKSWYFHFPQHRTKTFAFPLMHAVKYIVWVISFFYSPPRSSFKNLICIQYLQCDLSPLRPHCRGGRPVPRFEPGKGGLFYLQHGSYSLQFIGNLYANMFAKLLHLRK